MSRGLKLGASAMKADGEWGTESLMPRPPYLIDTWAWIRIGRLRGSAHFIRADHRAGAVADVVRLEAEVEENESGGQRLEADELGHDLVRVSRSPRVQRWLAAGRKHLSCRDGPSRQRLRLWPGCTGISRGSAGGLLSRPNRKPSRKAFVALWVPQMDSSVVVAEGCHVHWASDTLCVRKSFGDGSVEAQCEE